MADSTRTFIAAAVPDALALRVERLQQQLATELPGARWSATPPFHVTLAFLGDVPHTDLVAVCRAAASAASAFAPIRLQLEGLGVFPDPARARVVWAGVTGPGVEALRGLQAALARAVGGVNYPTDGKPFHPHVTLGRFKPGRGAEPGRERRLAQLIGHYKTWHAGPFTVNEAVVFASTQTPEGPAYAPLSRARLSGREPGTSP